MSLPDGSAHLGEGLQLRSTERIRSFLGDVAKLDMPKEQSLVKKYASGKDGDSVPVRLIQHLCNESRKLSSGGYWMHDIVQGSEILWERPVPRKKSAELEARLAALTEAEEVRQYNELVKDVTRREVASRERERFVTYKDQLGFGVHVLAIMFTGYVIGHTIMRAQFPDEVAHHVAGGAIGLIVGMLVEMFLFIIRTTKEE